MITLQQWKDCEGQAFTLVNGDSLTLAEVTMPISPEGWECFSLLFAGQLQLEQGEKVLKNGAQTLMDDVLDRSAERSSMHAQERAASALAEEEEGGSVRKRVASTASLTRAPASLASVEAPVPAAAPRADGNKTEIFI